MMNAEQRRAFVREHHHRTLTLSPPPHSRRSQLVAVGHARLTQGTRSTHRSHPEAIRRWSGSDSDLHQMRGIDHTEYFLNRCPRR